MSGRVSSPPAMGDTGGPPLAYHVLIVDDSAMTRRMLRKTLQVAGCTCDEAEDGAQAVDRVRSRLEAMGLSSEERQYDAILMDFIMVRMCVRVRGYVCVCTSGGDLCLLCVYLCTCCPCMSICVLRARV